MPKLNKPRRGVLPTEAEAREILASQGFQAATIREVSHSSDGSMFVLDGCVGHVIEFNPELSTKLASAFMALGIAVNRN